jgi:hypothetical protein
MPTLVLLKKHMSTLLCTNVTDFTRSAIVTAPLSPVWSAFSSSNFCDSCIHALPQRQLLLHECKAGKTVSGAQRWKLTAFNSICRSLPALVQERREVMLESHIISAYRTWRYETCTINACWWLSRPIHIRTLLRAT